MSTGYCEHRTKMPRKRAVAKQHNTSDPYRHNEKSQRMLTGGHGRERDKRQAIEIIFLPTYM